MPAIGPCMLVHFNDACIRLHCCLLHVSKVMVDSLVDPVHVMLNMYFLTVLLWFSKLQFMICSQVSMQANSQTTQRIVRKGLQISMVDQEVATIHQNHDTATCLLDHNDPVIARLRNCQDEVQARPQLNEMLHHSIVQVLLIEYSRLIALVQM